VNLTIMAIRALLLLLLTDSAAALQATASKGRAAKALAKKRGLAVSVELAGDTLADSDLELLSMQLRKSHAAALWTASVTSVAAVAKEQASARGDFPGPCPVIYNGDAEHVSEAIAAGATAVVLDAAHAGSDAASAADEVIWHVSSADDVRAIVEAASSSAGAFIAPSSADADAIRAALPEGSVSVCAINGMSAQNAEIPCGRALVSGGCNSLLVSNACVGDDEDVPYVQWAIAELNSKQSAEFKIDGHTGAINGHFGGGPRPRPAGEMEWKRLAR